MIETIVKLAGAVLCFGIGAVLFSFGICFLAVLINEIWRKMRS
jgi:hypothetical protein